MIRNILLYLWQLPQNVAGTFLVWMYGYDKAFPYLGAEVHVCRQFPSGICLGNYIIVKRDEPVTVAHEYGHHRQSLRWGWLYLPTVGLWSVVHLLCRRAGIFWKRRSDYYAVWPENRADKLGGVWRDDNGRRCV